MSWLDKALPLVNSLEEQAYNIPLVLHVQEYFSIALVFCFSLKDSLVEHPVPFLKTLLLCCFTLHVVLKNDTSNSYVFVSHFNLLPGVFEGFFSVYLKN